MTAEEQKDLTGKGLGKIKKETEEKHYVILTGKAFRIKVAEEKVEEIKGMKDKRKKIQTIIRRMRCYIEDEPLDGQFEADKRALIAWFGG